MSRLFGFPARLAFGQRRLTSLARRWSAVAIAVWSLVVGPVVQAENIIFGVGQSTGSNRSFTASLPITYNFGVTDAGAAAGLSAIQFRFTANRGNNATAPVIFTIYDGLGATGNVIATTSIPATAFGASFVTVDSTLSAPVTLPAGAFSIQLTTDSAGSGADTWLWKDGPLRLLSSSGTDLGRFLYVGDSNTTGTAGTTLTAATGVLAQPSLAAQSVSFGNFRVGSSLSQIVWLSNNNLPTANNYSEALATASVTTGSASISGVPTAASPLNQGFAAELTVGLASGVAGPTSGSIDLTFSSVKGSSDSPGPFPTAVGSGSIAVSGTGYREATAGFSTTEVSLGRFHVGATNVTGTLTLANTQTTGPYSEGLAAATTGSSGGAAVVSGLPTAASPLAAGGQTTITVSLASVATVGTGNAGTVTLGLETSGAGTSGLAAASIGSQLVNVMAQGYSGQSIWSRNSGGGWGSFESWDVPGGLPGVDGSLSVADTATFGSGPTGTTTVLLDGASPQLASLSFETAGASYSIAPGSGGSLTVGTSAATGSVAVTAGSHTIATGLALGRDTTFTTDAGTRLTLGGALSGTSGLVKAGLGELLVTGSGSLSGATTVAAGTLRVNGSIGSGALTVESGATLAGSGTVGPLTIKAGGTLSPGNSPGVINVDGDAIWEPGGSYNWQIHNAAGAPGTGWDLTNIAGDLDLTNLDSLNRFNINLWSLAEIEPDVNGAAINFNPGLAYSWTIASVAEGKSILGFSPDLFTLQLAAANGTSGFANSLAGGSFSIVQDDRDLNLVFVPVPEPGWLALLLAGGGLGFGLLRRRAKGRGAAGV